MHGTRLRQALLSGVVWQLGLLCFLIIVGLYGQGLWLPQIIKGSSQLNDFAVGLRAPTWSDSSRTRPVDTPARCSPSESSCSRARPSRSRYAAPQARSADAAKRGGRRAFVACSYANASLIKVASVHGRPTNESPTGSPRTCPIGSVTCG